MSGDKLEKSFVAAQGRVVLGRQLKHRVLQTASDSEVSADDSLDQKKSVSGLREELALKEQTIGKLEQKIELLQSELELAQTSLSEIEGNLEALEKDAESRGYEKGLERCAAELQVSISKQSEEWQSGIITLVDQHDEFCNRLKSQVADIVMASVTKIIGDQMVTADAIRQGIDHIVRESGEIESFKIFLAPKHYEQLTSTKNFKLVSVRGRHIELFPDVRVEYGGCILEGLGGLIDGRYEIQLGRLRDIISSSAAELLE